MPQFDTFSFLSQLFWLFTFFFIILFFLNYYFLPAISTSFKVRNSIFSSKKYSSISIQTAVNNVFCFQGFLPTTFEKQYFLWSCYYVARYCFLKENLLANFVYNLFFINFFQDIYSFSRRNIFSTFLIRF
jgi:hypothetical protein